MYVISVPLWPKFMAETMLSATLFVYSKKYLAITGTSIRVNVEEVYSLSVRTHALFTLSGFVLHSATTFPITNIIFYLMLLLIFFTI